MIKGMSVEAQVWTLPSRANVGVGTAEIYLRRDVERAHRALLECVGELARHYEANRMWDSAIEWVQVLMVFDGDSERYAQYQGRLAYLRQRAGLTIPAGQRAPDRLARCIVNVGILKLMYEVLDNWGLKRFRGRLRLALPGQMELFATG